MDDIKKWVSEEGKVEVLKSKIDSERKAIQQFNTQDSNISSINRFKVPSTAKISKHVEPPHSPPKSKPLFSSPSKPAKSDNLVGRRVEVWWDKEKKWYPGVVDKVSDNLSKGTHEVLYDDELDEEDPNIYEFLEGDNKAQFRFLPDGGS